MDVIKRDHSIQKLDMGKIRLVLERISDETNEPLTLADIHYLSKTIEDAIRNTGQNKIESSVIQEIVLKVLKNSGFQHIAFRYMEYERDL